MERRTPIFIIASPRPRVGKTLLARALAEFFRIDERPVAAFDVNPDQFALVDHLPGYTAVASIGDIRGQMALFDQLVVADHVPKIVDLGHTEFDRFFGVMQDIAFTREAGHALVQPVVLFLPDGDRRAQQGYAMLNDRFPDLALVPVINEAVPVVTRYRDDFPGTRLGGAPLAIPALAPVIRTVIERPGFSFAAYCSKTEDQTSELFGWTRKVFLEFRELELRMLLADLKPSLQFKPDMEPEWPAAAGDG